MRSTVLTRTPQFTDPAQSGTEPTRLRLIVGFAFGPACKSANMPADMELTRYYDPPDPNAWRESLTWVCHLVLQSH